MRASRVPPNTIFVYLRVLERVSDVLRTSRGRKRYPARTAFTTFSDIPRPPRSQHHDQVGFERPEHDARREARRARRKPPPPRNPRAVTRVPATAKRARSRGGRQGGIHVAGPKKDNLRPRRPTDAPLQWGRQKARGADPGAEHVDKPQIRHVLEATDEENLGFESLLQLADAGVHLEKRGKKRAKNSGAANAKGGKAGGKKGQVDGGKGQVKKRGRGPNKVQESEEEREAKRLRRAGQQGEREADDSTQARNFDDLSGRAKVLEETNQTLRDQVNALYDEMKSLASKKRIYETTSRLSRRRKVCLFELPKQPDRATPRMVPADDRRCQPASPPRLISDLQPAALAQAQPASRCSQPQCASSRRSLTGRGSAAATARSSSQAPPNPAMMWPPPAMIPNPYAMFNPAAMAAMSSGRGFPPPATLQVSTAANQVHPSSRRQRRLLWQTVGDKHEGVRRRHNTDVPISALMYL